MEVVMRVTHAVIGKVQPGRLEDAITLARDGAKLVGRYGGDVRLLSAAVAGEATGTTVFAIDYVSTDAFATAMQEMSTDTELQAFTARANVANSPSIIVSDSMSIDVPTAYTSKGGRGSVVEVHLNRPVPGRLEAALAMCAKVCEFAEANGAANARTFQLSYAGMMSGVWGVSWETADWLASGRLGAAWMSDPLGLEIQTQSLSADNPTTQVSSAVYQDIPL
jgi:hypothetical protein